jgi:lipoprotein NlpD
MTNTRIPQHHKDTSMIGYCQYPKLLLPLSRMISVAFGALVLLSCSHHAPAPVVNLSSFSGIILEPETFDSLPEFHVVEPGDTLFSIAWRYGVDYRQLAEMNDIGDNFRIYPGQKIRFALQQPPVDSGELDPQELKLAVRQALGLPLAESSQQNSNTSEHKVSKHSQQKVYSKVSIADSNKKSTKNARQRLVESGNDKLSAAKVGQWHWPVKGKILERFSKELHGNKGLDILAKPGEPVRAAAPGRVVYSGNALKGYGNLVIVKHNDDYLSAYAHNSKIHVQENEIVKAGQVIADIGNSGTDQSKLHFEIRYRGKPVDPIKYLPKL